MIFSLVLLIPYLPRNYKKLFFLYGDLVIVFNSFAFDLLESRIITRVSRTGRGIRVSRRERAWVAHK